MLVVDYVDLEVLPVFRVIFSCFQRTLLNNMVYCKCHHNSFEERASELLIICDATAIEGQQGCRSAITAADNVQYFRRAVPVYNIMSRCYPVMTLALLLKNNLLIIKIIVQCIG